MLGGRMADISSQDVGRLLFDRFVQVSKKGFDATMAIPPDYQWGNFIADREHQDRRMIGEAAAVLAGPVEQIFQSLRIIYFAPSRSPANVGEEIKSGSGSGISQPIGRRNVEADGVDACSAHLRKVITHLRARWKWF